MRFLLFAGLFLVAPLVAAYESDQYSNRLVPVDDSLEVLDKRVNDALEEIAREWDEPDDEDRDLRFAKAVYRELGGLHWADKIERWASKTPLVDKYPKVRYSSVYQGLPIWGRRINFLFGVCVSFRLNDVIMGSDKLGHFFSQGLKYYKRKERGWSMERVADFGATAERFMWGQLTTGIFANADLVANYEGMRFYQSLFQDGVIEGKGPIMEWRDGKPHQLRPFTWADHVNDYWDEALNPSHVVDSLYPGLRERIRDMCPQYEKQPSAFIAENDAALWDRYEHIGLKDMRENKFKNICGTPAMDVTSADD
ncbi:MAG: hypothetical protein HUJ31_12925 [Pseudomonadales bacterium]|nr:hypothetical protein [Pseudomonadales bacterium]